MVRKTKLPVSVLCGFGFLIGLHASVSSVELPSATQEMMKKLKLDATIMANIDRELSVPKDWIAKAKQEEKLKILSTSSTVNPNEIKAFYASFKERYPFVGIEQSGASMEARVIKTLLAYKRGKVVTDILTNLEEVLVDYKQTGALEDLRNIPTWKAIPEGAKDPDGTWVSPGVRYYCVAYNTKLVDRKDLPRKWEDILTNPKWRGGNLALVNRPQHWVPNLWATKGEQWTKNFLTGLFGEVKPQLRKEGLNAMLELLAAGEFHAVIAAQSNLAHQKAAAGAPVGFSCPDFVPVSRSEVVILKGASSPYAARVFINWLLSVEGQISQYFARNAPPAHTDLMRAEFVEFADEILGKKHSYVDPALEVEILAKLNDPWKDFWMGKGVAR